LFNSTADLPPLLKYPSDDDNDFTYSDPESSSDNKDYMSIDNIGSRWDQFKSDIQREMNEEKDARLADWEAQKKNMDLSETECEDAHYDEVLRGNGHRDGA
jgi:hypothetical protein